MGVSLEAIRVRQSVSIGELAQTTDIPRDVLLAYEAGTRRAEARHVATLARVLGVPVSALFAAALRPRR